jgi:hypothetical protein
MSRRALRLLVIAALAVAGAIAVAPSPAGAGPGAPSPSGMRTPNPGLDDFFAGVSAVSSSDVWAAGYFGNNNTGAFKTLIAHWNGTAWKKFASPSPGSHASQLFGVSADSATDAWAVGTYDAPSGSTPLIERWNGTAWSQLIVPQIGFNDVLFGVSARSPSDVWAVGSYNDSGTGQGRCLILHWDGSSWVQKTGVNPGPSSNELRGAVARTSSDVWAVGHYNDAGGAPKTLVLHWNGSTWKQSPSPSPGGTALNHLCGVTATASNDAWAVGRWDTNGFFRALSLHWDGTSWTQVSTPVPTGTFLQLLSSVDAISASDVWAAGTAEGGSGFTTYLIHWNGTKWSKVASPNPSSTNNELLGVSADATNDAWSVGYEVDDVSSHFRTLGLRWNGTTWSVS